MRTRIPYGKSFLEMEIENSRVAGVITGNLDTYESGRTEEELVRKAMAHPIESPALKELVKGKNNIVIIASDHTRPVPSKVIIPLMLEEIKTGNPEAKVTILIATGCHRGTTEEELMEKFGEKILNQVRIVIHDCDREDQVFLGKLPSGGDLIIDRVAAEADLLLAEGFIEPHFFAGYSGGRKSVLPGIASRKTVYANHCAEFIADPRANYGMLEGNPIHKDMIFAAGKAGLTYIVNVVINSRHKVIGAFAGHFEKAHLEGVKFLEGLCLAKAVPAPIVVTSNNGHPMDQNIYQAVKGMATAENCCEEGGVIIIAAECGQGCGGEGFHHTFRDERDPGRILQNILSVGRNETEADQWQSQIYARILDKHRVVLVSETDPELVKEMHMYPARSMEEALEVADSFVGADKKITLIPEGLTSIII